MTKYPDDAIHHDESFLEMFIETTSDIKEYKGVAEILKQKYKNVRSEYSIHRLNSVDWFERVLIDSIKW